MTRTKGFAGFVSVLVAGASLLACAGDVREGEATAQAQDLASAASTFACGDAPPCDASTQYCKHVTGGRFDVNSYTCFVVPAKCATDVTCACIDPAGPGIGAAPSCSSAGGGVTVSVLAP
jgi:hypothetical protein